MKIRSTFKIVDRFNINEVFDGMCDVTIVDLDSEKEIKTKHEDIETITYEYDCVEVHVVHNVEYIEEHLDTLYANGVAKEQSRLQDVSVNDRLEAIEEAILELVG